MMNFLYFHLLDLETLSELNSIEDCCRFVEDIRRVALELGLYEDKKWMADYAATRLGGQALLWHALELNGGTRSNWDRLQLAIIERAQGADADSPAEFRRRLGSNQSILTTSSARTTWSQGGSLSSSFLHGPDAPLVDSPASDASHIGILYTSIANSSRTRSDSSQSSVPRGSYAAPELGKLLLKDYTGDIHYVGVSISLYGLFKRTSKENEALYLKVDRDLGKLYLQSPRSWSRTLGITWDIDQDRNPRLGKGSK
ncbi:hypothetical protein FRC00_010393, partial [Tulasnella sp. 408]